MPGDKRMRTDDFGTNPDGHMITLQFQDSISPGIAVGNGVAVTEIGDIRLTRDLPAFLPPKMVGRDGMEALQVLLVQPVERDLVGSAVVFGVHPVTPPAELPVHVVQ